MTNIMHCIFKMISSSQLNKNCHQAYTVMIIVPTIEVLYIVHISYRKQNTPGHKGCIDVKILIPSQLREMFTRTAGERSDPWRRLACWPERSLTTNSAPLPGKNKIIIIIIFTITIIKVIIRAFYDHHQFAPR